MCDLMPEPPRPSQPLEFKEPLDSVFRDEGRNYCKLITGLYGWEFTRLANHLDELISRPRCKTSTKKRKCKHNNQHRLYFGLDWLHSCPKLKKQEFNSGWAKSSVHEDIPHVLKALVDGLAGYISWPDAATRERWADQSEGIFSGCIGILDITETEIEKPKDPVWERETWSGKMKCNTLKTLTVISKAGEVIFILTGIPGGRSDRDIWTSCDLYLNAGEYFSEGEWIASDGGFMGDGNIMMSHNDIAGDEDKALFNMIFTEMRKQVENQYGRIAMWFPILGNCKKRWNYNLTLFKLTVLATYHLHNWIMVVRGLNYDPSTNPRYLFSRYF